MMHTNFKRKLLKCIESNSWITFERLCDEFERTYGRWINDEIIGKTCDELTKEKYINESTVNTKDYNSYGYLKFSTHLMYTKLKDLPEV